MSEVVELVARAICRAERMNEDDPLGGWRTWTDAAKEAIIAMRDVPASIRVDIEGSDRWNWTCHVCGGPKENWERAIDAALKD